MDALLQRLEVTLKRSAELGSLICCNGANEEMTIWRSAEMKNVRLFVQVPSDRDAL
jgi:hypothetical protein